MNLPQQSLDHNPDFEALLNYLKRNRGFDFTGYKRSSLMRRINKRMQTLNLEGFKNYVDFLEVHPDEFVDLFDTILINVTTFFRDQDTWDYLKTQVVPSIIANKAPHEPIRIWSAACASGEEAYSLAILLAEALGLERFREQVKIYATDVDENALNQARQASYSQRDITELPAPILEKYFEQSNTRYLFRKDLRRGVIFGRHDLLQDAPISRIDLLLCRNVLMYFNSESQSRILTRFHFALKDTGVLVMGKAEMLYTHQNLFTPLNIRRRVFKKMLQVKFREHLLSMVQPDSRENGDRLSKHLRLRENAFDVSAEAQCVVDLNGFIVLINDRARSLLNLDLKDLNRPLKDLDLYTRIAELKARIQDSYSDSRVVTIKEVEWVTEAGEVRTLDIQIIPMRDAGNDAALGVSIIFRDLTSSKRLQEKLEYAHQELETAYEELQSTNEELETTNEELQSTIEELETTNEELQSTNEELETINEELQSTNEEMQTVNKDFHTRTIELNRANSFLESILMSMNGGVVVIDPDFRVLIWSQKTEEMWGLRAQEVQNKNFLNLDIGLPVEQLKVPLRSCLSGESQMLSLNMEAVNRRGKSIQCKITCTPMFNVADSKVEGVIMITEAINQEL